MLRIRFQNHLNSQYILWRNHIEIRLVQRDFRNCHHTPSVRDNCFFVFYLIYRNRSTIYRDQIFEESYRSPRDSTKRHYRKAFETSFLSSRTWETLRRTNHLYSFAKPTKDVQIIILVRLSIFLISGISSKKERNALLNSTIDMKFRCVRYFQLCLKNIFDFIWQTVLLADILVAIEILGKNRL